MLGVAYKADIGDMRESPALKLIELLENAGADVSYHDPHVPELREHGLSMLGRARAGRVRLRRDRHRALRRSTTSTSSSDAQLVVDFRNATGDERRRGAAKVWKL